MKMTKVLLATLLLMISGITFAQKKEIKGKVTDAVTGEPMPGVSVLGDKKSTTATATTSDGTYSIKVDTKASVLIFSSVGYTTQTVEIGSKTTINVNLQPSATSMDEIVVIGYGTQRKSHMTGSVSKLKSEKLDEAPVSRLDQALQGKIAGVQIQNTTSEAGATPRVRIRGLSSINAGADPLVVVDGHPVPDGLAFVNMADVESVEVLKDAASAAIYGSRGANGVIMVTTKSGKVDKPKYTLKASTGTKSAYSLHPMMTLSEYTNLMYYEASLREKDSTVPRSPASNIQKLTNQEKAMYVIENDLLGGIATNWQDEAVRTANMSNIQFNVSGGKKEAKYFISGNYQKDQGIMYHSEYDKVSLRGKLDAQLSKRVKLNINLNPSYSKRERPAVNFIDFYRFYSFLPVRHTAASAAWVNQAAQWAHIKSGDWAQARHFNNLIYSGTMPDGTVWNNTAPLTPWSTSNNTPKSIMETRNIFSNDYRMLSSGDLSINLAKGLDFKTNASAYTTFNETTDFTKRNSSKDGDVNKGVYSNQLFIDLLSENTLTYNKKVKDHVLNLLGGFTAQKTFIKNAQTTGLDFPSDEITTLNTALQIDQANTYTRKNQIGLLSYLGRATYSFKDRYLLAASYRADGSSYFAPGHKWGTFPSVSLGWVVSEEDFMQDNSWISMLKLRGSYGVTGNNKIQDFAFVDLLYPANYSFGSGTGNVTPGQAPARDVLANPDITWERTFEYNIGADINLFKDLINLSVEAYQSQTDQLLLKQASMGFTGVNQTWNNIGRLKNNGIEIELTTNNVRTKNLKWRTMANISGNRNKLLDIGGEAFQLNYGERNEVYSAELGYSSIRFFGYKTDGVWLSQAEADAAKAKDKGTNLANYFTAGGLKLVDVNNDGKIDAADRTVTGSPFPKFSWGLTNNINYKAFDLSFMFQGVQGNDLINGDAYYNESRKINKNYNDGNRWVSPLFPGDGKTPYFTNGVDWMLTDYVVEDGSYFALRELIVGYTLPEKLIKSAKLSGLRMYCSVQNAYVQMAKNYRGINPEARYTSGNYSTPLIDGYQRGGFPMPRTILFGLDVNF